MRAFFNSIYLYDYDQHLQSSLFSFFCNDNFIESTYWVSLILFIVCGVSWSYQTQLGYDQFLIDCQSGKWANCPRQVFDFINVSVALQNYSNSSFVSGLPESRLQESFIPSSLRQYFRYYLVLFMLNFTLPVVCFYFIFKELNFRINRKIYKRSSLTYNRVTQK